MHIGPSETEPFLSFFLKGFLRRGLGGVMLVVSDAHEGLPDISCLQADANFSMAQQITIPLWKSISKIVNISFEVRVGRR
ncbi:Mobile element protein [Desulfovibrio sp. TomC]|nr:Mobile element protein [Desulfovibrio sp. TomC]